MSFIFGLIIIRVAIYSFCDFSRQYNNGIHRYYNTGLGYIFLYIIGLIMISEGSEYWLNNEVLMYSIIGYTVMILLILISGLSFFATIEWLLTPIWNKIVKK